MLIYRITKGFSKQIQRKVILMPGDGIGPEITEATVRIIDTLKLPIEWEHHKIHSKAVTKEGDLIDEKTIKGIQECGFGLKGPFETPIGKGHRSLNLTLRKKLKLYANLRPCITINGVKGLLYDNINLVTIRENTEGEYSGLEHQVAPGIIENLKIITEKACEDVCRFAFEYAKKYGRKKVTCAHKADVMKLSDGCFLRVAQKIAKEYPDIIYEEKQVDSICTRLINHPENLDVMVMPNLYGDILSDLCAGLVGGLGMTPSGNIGFDCSVYEAVHGTAPDIAGKGVANPTALLLSSAMMLEHMNFIKEGLQIRNAVTSVIGEGKWITRDLGGKASTKEYTDAIINAL